MENFTLEQIREQLFEIENSNLDYYKKNVAIIVSDKNKFNDAVDEIANNYRNEIYDHWEDFASEMNSYPIPKQVVFNISENYCNGDYFSKTSIKNWSKDFARILFEKQCWVYNFIVFQQETIYTTTFALNN